MMLKQQRDAKGAAMTEQSPFTPIGRIDGGTVFKKTTVADGGSVI